MSTRLTRGLATVAAVAVCVALAACSPHAGGSASPSSASASSAPVAPDATTPSKNTGAPMASTPIRITIDGTTLEATLNDSPAARALADRLPLSLVFSDYGGQEVLAPLSPALPMEGMPAGESAPAGTIGYYAPDDALVLYYTDVGRFNGIVRLGEIHGDIAILRDWDSAREVSLELAG